MQIKGLLFDKDGTLFDFQETWGRWAGKMLRSFSRDDDELKKMAEVMEYDHIHNRFFPNSAFIAGTAKSMYESLTALRPDLRAEEMIGKINEMAQNVEIVAVCNLSELLGALGQNYKLGVATNDKEHSTIAQLTREGVRSQFDYIAGCDSGYGEKPDAGMCAEFAKQMKIKPEECLMIGDSEFDMMAGRAAGMGVIGVLTGPATREDLAPYADHILPSIADLPGWLASKP